MQSVVVTGASSGLGRKLASRLALHGCRVIASGRDPERLRDPLPDFDDRASSGMWVPVVGDLREAATLDRIEYEARRYGVDALFNAAGVYRHGTLAEHDDALTAAVIETNLIAVVQLTRRIYPAMARGACVVNVNSIAAKDGGAEEAAYAASKAGLSGFSRALRFEARRAGVTVLDVYLGAMKTAMKAGVTDYELLIDAAEAASLILDLTAARETLQVEEVTIRRRMYELSDAPKTGDHL